MRGLNEQERKAMEDGWIEYDSGVSHYALDVFEAGFLAAKQMYEPVIKDLQKQLDDWEATQ